VSGDPGCSHRDGQIIRNITADPRVAIWLADPDIGARWPAGPNV
jgi:hypothetical protein